MVTGVIEIAVGVAIDGGSILLNVAPPETILMDLATFSEGSTNIELGFVGIGAGVTEEIATGPYINVSYSDQISDITDMLMSYY